MCVVGLVNKWGTEGSMRPCEGLLGRDQDPAHVANHGYVVAWMSRWVVFL